jgi:hypothetical protein
MTTRRHFLATLAATTLILATGHALAAPPLVEIIAMPHPPVRMALAPLREWLTAQGARVRVKEIDIESTEGEKRMLAAGLSGHIPILILIDGQYRHKGKDGTALEFVNFPAIEGAPIGVRGHWTTADVQAILTGRMKQP